MSILNKNAILICIFLPIPAHAMDPQPELALPAEFLALHIQDKKQTNPAASNSTAIEIEEKKAAPLQAFEKTASAKRLEAQILEALKKRQKKNKARANKRILKNCLGVTTATLTMAALLVIIGVAGSQKPPPNHPSHTTINRTIVLPTIHQKIIPPKHHKFRGR